MPSTTFLEEEDKMLVQIASKYLEQGSKRIAWKDVARKMKRWKRSPEELARRINSLKPIATIFESVTRQEVVYPGCSPHLNAGEILPSGVSALIAAIQHVGVIQPADVFMDIGSGVGNVIVQFALMTPVRACVEIEIRDQFVDRCHDVFGENVATWPDLQKVEVYAVDANQVELSMIYPFSSSTIVFANNLRFEPATTNHITSEFLFLTDAWLIAVTSEICPRHNSMCTQEFCSRWMVHSFVDVPVSWTSNTVTVYLYTERKKSN
ncbi:histone H3-K79 methyltransferase [Phytophthora cactorum]|nr:histone H3-K79 methyltransferase [Phytophthora cactorum]